MEPMRFRGFRVAGFRGWSVSVLRVYGFQCLGSRVSNWAFGARPSPRSRVNVGSWLVPAVVKLILGLIKGVYGG